ncbi:MULTISPECIES: DUF805 domain-containing protein [unclassified Arcicella]|uniref:DUF805 domain-containing protein n=1 Tax=unclassified Arcicella TaxID=2644986 RepID=UPI0028574721|nr:MULTISPECIES: DUF805 domain-containing protein [unclassified Arcicella]MDR6562513.1 uncharacterized membrane protein YhaH (DUF805 family) [Arcicella sp. BE51]MDR6812600.1 uncharacterized membrane protein YhaH (DUF805 family) [Arcicella sp. BE140]MDR6823912.1 uncharacterized membrane protein YhaH (DUF805 family) [Arcicella sp. BE139]
MNYYLQVLQNYATFRGRARRSEYWYYFLFNMLFAFVAVIVDNVLGTASPLLGYGPIYGLYALATLIPGLAVLSRRLHDIGKSGWYFLIVLIPFAGVIWLLVLLVTEGEPFDNQYGTNPKAVNDELMY